MSDAAENAASRLWRDRAQLREQERNEAQARACLAERQVTALTAENDRLASRNTHLSDQNNRLAAEIARLRTHVPDSARGYAETEQQMEALRTELLSLLDPPSESGLH